ncbi:unnamed protein product [Thelazia callipaeda]|uniref:Gag/pol protein n=1 Tax=Thelazia callipaeda TaxID=103827 RepID=A0A0N5DCG8_THECL|nr:unnamed protein product [Thelazia callipaeda]
MAQQCYEDMTRREKKPSGQKTSIKKKIKCNFYKTPEQYFTGETLENLNMKDAKKCMRSMNPILAFKRDCHALSMLTERMRVYESKIIGYESRCAFKI